VSPDLTRFTLSHARESICPEGTEACSQGLQSLGDDLQSSLKPRQGRRLVVSCSFMLLPMDPEQVAQYAGVAAVDAEVGCMTTISRQPDSSGASRIRAAGTMLLVLLFNG
jgi:hypothetical protein